MKNETSPSTEKSTIINAFTLIASIFFGVYAAYYLATGDYYLGYGYVVIFAGVIASLIIFKRIRNETLALSVLASLGLPVLIPWQISGGVGVAGIFWYYIYIVWLFFLLGRNRGLVWIIGVFLISIGEFVLQRLGHLPSPYSLETMLSFYFGFILETAVLYVSQSTKEKADRQVANEKTKLQGILDNMSEGVEAVDLKGNLIFFNQAAQEMLGVNLNQKDPSQWKKIYTVYESDKLTPADEENSPINRALRGEKTQIEQYVKNKQTKKGVYVLAKGSPLRDHEGKVTGGIAIFSDITNSKQTESKLLEAKSKDEAILGSIGDGVVAIDGEGTIVLFNYAAQIMSGRLRHEVLGKPYKKVLAFYNDQGEPDTDFVTIALAGKRSDIARDGLLRRKDDTMMATAHSAAPIVDAQGSVDGAVIVFRDTTRERQLEHMKDEFLAVASHELRTPMGAVRANLAMILDGDYGPVNKGLIAPLTDMKSSTVRLVELVNDLLNVARIEAGRMLFTLSDFDIIGAARDVVASLAPLGKERGLRVTLKADDKHVDIQADIAKVKQVLTNLIGNSLKFTDKGSVTVSIHVKKDVVELSVSDTGVGIARDDQGLLFTKFNQITPAQATKPAGTGLGLYISREIIRRLGGDLWLAQSVVNKGSTFTFTLPRTQSSAAGKAKRSLKQEAAHHPDQK
jgi:PAS domain S-box-containing protein